MTYKPYKQEKKQFDNQVFSYLMKRVFEDYDESDGCHEGIIDGIGNVIGNPDSRSEWSYTMLDQFINMLKQNLSEEALRGIFKQYSYMRDIDALFIIKNGDIDYSQFKEGFSNIITKVNDKSFLPEYLFHEDSYVEEEEGLNFTDQVSRSLTVGTFLLYTLRGNRNLVDVDFSDVLESVECTFNMRPFGTFDVISKFCNEHGLIDSSAITEEGIRLLVMLSKEVTDCNILTKYKEMRHNHRANWIKLSKVND
jgi:hypothetical protein